LGGQAPGADTGPVEAGEMKLLSEEEADAEVEELLR
jgi:hypothetical protein